MSEINTEKLSKEMNDTLVHRACVMRSGSYLARYLIYKNRSVDAIRLLGRCSIHDISKIQSTEEFMSLASIVDDISEMQDVEHVLSDEQENSIKLHWSRNSHHPEYYENPNDMSELDLLEMACDCHARSKQYGTNLMEFIEVQQRIRFHFDNEHFKKIKAYCSALIELTKNDDYSSVLGDTKIKFDLKDETMEKLENFDVVCYKDLIESDFIYLRRYKTADFASIAYTIYLSEDKTEIGYIVLKFNSFIEFNIYDGYKGMGYDMQALDAFMAITTMDDLFIQVKKSDYITKDCVEKLGFVPNEVTEGTIIYRFKRPSKQLVRK